MCCTGHMPVFLQPFLGNGTLRSNCDAVGTHAFWGGTPEANLRPRAREGFLVPTHQLQGLGEHCKLPQRGSGRAPTTNIFWTYTKSLENVSSGRKCRTQFSFLLSTGGPAEPSDTTGGTLRLRRTLVEKHWHMQSTAGMWMGAVFKSLFNLKLQHSVDLCEQDNRRIQLRIHSFTNYSQ